MQIDELTNTFFFRLPLFKPGHGFYVDDKQGKYDFLTYVNQGRDWDKIHFQRPAELKLSISSFASILNGHEGLAYSCTEQNLINLFLKPDQIACNEHRKITNTQLSYYADMYKEGYKNGSKISIADAIGKSYISLSGELKTGVVKEFCQQCHYYSFFEGFAVPDCFKGIGYLQGLLFTAFREYSFLKRQAAIKELPSNPGLSGEQGLVTKAPQEECFNKQAGPAIQIEKETVANQPGLRISLRSSEIMKDLELLWSLLLIPVDDSPVILKSRTDISHLVKQLFLVKNETPMPSPKSKVDLTIFETRHRSIIEFLMRFSKLRIEGNTQNNTLYCSLLKYSFLGVYAGNQHNKEVQVSTISSHWMKKTNECLQNLRKTQLPKPLFTLINDIMNQNDFKSKPLTLSK